MKAGWLWRVSYRKLHLRCILKQLDFRAVEKRKFSRQRQKEE